MKTVILIFGLMFTILSVKGQWYFNQYGVTDMNELNKDQLELALVKSEKLKTNGAIVTGVSTLATIVGSVLYFSGLNNMLSDDYTVFNSSSANSAIAGSVIAGVGVTGMSIGIPMWIIGSQRIDVVEIHLRKYGPVGQAVPSIGFKFNLKTK